VERKSVLPPNPKTLHIGCGSGLGCVYLAQRNATAVTGVDTTGLVLSRARDLAFGRNLSMHFIRSDVNNLQELHDSDFDFVFERLCIVRQPRKLNAYQSIAKVMQKGGYLLTVTLNKTETFEEAVKSGLFTLVWAKNTGIEVPVRKDVNSSSNVDDSSPMSVNNNTTTDSISSSRSSTSDGMSNSSTTAPNSVSTCNNDDDSATSNNANSPVGSSSVVGVPPCSSSSMGYFGYSRDAHSYAFKTRDGVVALLRRV